MPPPTQVFAALSEETRLKLLRRLSDGGQHSIMSLSHGSTLTRQAVSKHLRVLQKAQLIRCHRLGRETLCQLEPEALRRAQDFLSAVSMRWDVALSRLKGLAEESSQS